MENENLVKIIREAAGMSQEALAREVGRSTGRVRQYEDGAKPPADVIERLKSLAAKSGHPELGIAAGGEWAIKHVINPGETLITQHRPPGGRHEKWHRLLDEILDFTDEEAKSAVQSNLVVFGKYVRAQREKGLKLRRKTS